jgi:hypothetical protein
MMAQPVIYSIPHHDDLPPHRVVERRRDDGSTVRFYIADNERIVWLETVALTGDTLESLIKRIVCHVSQVYQAARFAWSYQVLRAASAARMDLATGRIILAASGEMTANPVRSERL